MKITVGIPSRGRPLDLAAAVLSLDKLKSGGNEVEYVIAHDGDDDPTRETVAALMARDMTVHSLVAGRGLSLGALHNSMALYAEPEAIFLLWSDRCVAMGDADPNLSWDQALAFATMHHADRVLWIDSIHLAGAGQFVLTPQWRAALPGPPCPALFPFWFEDTHVEEIDAFVHGYPRISTWAKCAGPRVQKTNRCRDIEFWVRFFAMLRADRLAEAAKIAINLGLPARDNDEMVQHFEMRDKSFIERAPQLLEAYGEPSPPDDTYLEAYARASRMMSDRGVAV